MTRVSVVFTGGKISMAQQPAARGAVPTLSGREILAQTGGLDRIADVEPIDWGLVPGSHLTFAQLLDIARVLRDQLASRDVAGAVLVQGTDNIDETSFALDLLVDSDKPIVVTGAMRNATQDGYDGPDNIRAAVRCAAAPELRGLGTVVVLSGEIHGADDVLKTHTHAYTTFKSPNTGPIGSVDSSGLVVRRRRTNVRRLPALPERAAENVVLLTVVLGWDGNLIRLVRQAGADGFVIAATGSGNTPASVLEACEEAMAAGIPVVLATRCPSGRVTPGYAFPGGTTTWQRAGAIFAGYLVPHKARMALALGLGAGLTTEQLGELFGAYGGGFLDSASVTRRTKAPIRSAASSTAGSIE